MEGSGAGGVGGISRGGRRMAMNKYTREVSPERAKRTTVHPVLLSSRRVPVVYYLCRNRQLEHPHFMEVPLSSPDGLFLRDVIERLNALRGRGIASMYSWSSKRSYKNGFVWHDLSEEDDLILPAHTNEYVLKGSELFGDANSDRFAPVGTAKIQSLKQLPGPHASSNCHDDSPAFRHPVSAVMSPESRVANGKNSSWNGSPSLTEYKVYKSDGLANASTQTEEEKSRHASKETCTRGVSTDEGVLAAEENLEISENSVSPPPSSSGATSSSGGRTETLDSLIRADVNKINGFKMSVEEEVQMPNNARVKAANALMHLISCGSISVKDPTYESSFSRPKFPSLLFSSSLILGELDSLAEYPRFTSLRLEEKENFSGTLKHSSSYNADRSCKQQDSTENDESNPRHSKCIPRSLKVSLSKHPRSESMRSSFSDRPRNSSDGADGSASDCSSRRIIDSSSSRKLWKRLESFKQEERVIKIDES